MMGAAPPPHIHGPPHRKLLLSPGHLAKLKGLTQAKINEMARDNFEKEMRKHKDFFRKYGIFVLIYTDSDLADMGRVFADLRRFLEHKEAPQQLRFHIIDELLE
jgi:hypothetical protein